MATAPPLLGLKERPPASHSNPDYCLSLSSRNTHCLADGASVSPTSSFSQTSLFLSTKLLLDPASRAWDPLGPSVPGPLCRPGHHPLRCFFLPIAPPPPPGAQASFSLLGCVCVCFVIPGDTEGTSPPCCPGDRGSQPSQGLHLSS